VEQEDGKTGRFGDCLDLVVDGEIVVEINAVDAPPKLPVFPSSC
jgi:hypothetical protein